jgi:hypothetical protein
MIFEYANLIAAQAPALFASSFAIMQDHDMLVRHCKHLTPIFRLPRSKNTFLATAEKLLDPVLVPRKNATRGCDDKMTDYTPLMTARYAV